MLNIKRGKHLFTKDSATEFLCTNNIMIYNFCPIYGKIASKRQDVTQSLRF
jgi:hypothetical protein